MASEMVSVSFEFFPPGDDAAAGQLWDAVLRLAPLRPKFVSVTYGADGSTRSRTHECVMRILRNTALTVAPHLTCIGAPREEVRSRGRKAHRTGAGFPAAHAVGNPAGGVSRGAETPRGGASRNLLIAHAVGNSGEPPKTHPPRQEPGYGPDEASRSLSEYSLSVDVSPYHQRNCPKKAQNPQPYCGQRLVDFHP